MLREKTWQVALAGNPNVGKSTLFNCLTGLNQHTGNWTGKTVSLASGKMEYRGREIGLTDLPGIQTLTEGSPEEQLAGDYIESGEAEAVAVICDGSCLERNLILALQVMARHDKVLLCVNLMDEAQRCGCHVDVKALSGKLGVPVVAMSAGTGEGIEEFKRVLLELLEGFQPCHPLRLEKSSSVKDYVRKAEEIARSCVSGRRPPTKKGNGRRIAF